ncbi:hypothetical protein ACVWW7_003180 [Bradyrhizobium sp. LM6.9]
MVGIHVRDRSLLRRQQILGPGEVREELLGPEIDDAAEAGNQMGSRGPDPVEGEILEGNRRFRRGMGSEIPSPEQILVGIGLLGVTRTA